MGKLTSKTIRPSASGFAKGMVATAPMLAQVDEQLAANGFDTLEPDTLAGTWSLQQDPNTPGVAPKITASAGVVVSGAGSLVETAPGGGDFLLASAPGFTTQRPRTVRYSFLEVCKSNPSIAGNGSTTGTFQSYNTLAGGTPATVNYLSSGGNTPFVWNGGFGVSGQQKGGATPFVTGAPVWVLALAKPHNGAVLAGVTAYFYLPGQPLAAPTNGSWKIFLVNAAPGAALGEVTIGTGVFTVPSTASAWYAGGAVQKLQMNASTATSWSGSGINLQQFYYAIQIIDVGITAQTQTPLPVWTAIEVDYTGIASEDWSQ